MCEAVSMDDIATRIGLIRERIGEACRAADRDPAQVRLLPVSKRKPADAIREAVAVGCLRFGENTVQEARRKARELADLTDVSWAVVGHLQSNKARYLPEFAAEFQGLDSVSLAQELDARFQAAGRSLDVMIQVNSSGEPTKHGLAPQDVATFARSLRPFTALRVRGLMTIASRERPERDFATMEGLRQRLLDTDGLPGTYAELSMGMSGDLEHAIAHGATCVRVGTAIFGERPVAAT